MMMMSVPDNQYNHVDDVDQLISTAAANTHTAAAAAATITSSGHPAPWRQSLSSSICPLSCPTTRRPSNNVSRGVVNRRRVDVLCRLAPMDLLFLLTLLWSVLPVVLTFNVDTTVPLVKLGRPHSYFGFSVAQHVVWNQRQNTPTHVLLVGAPRDNITHVAASDEVRRIVRPGAIYQCPVTSLTTDCTQLSIDNEAPRPGEDKTDQWMGVTVVSQATLRGRALVCAHRHKKQGPGFQWGLGMCISLLNSLDEDRFWEPCEGKPKNKAHGEYGYCQTGTSAAVDSSGSVLFGSPGPYNWRGAVFSSFLDDSFEAFAAGTWYQSPVVDAQPEFGIPQPATGYYSYLGMSVKIGNIVNDERTFVAGAPRSRNTGQVLFFVPTSNGMTISNEHYLTGEQFGSGFGYDIAIADFNNDGKHDLVVGAPFYHAPYASGALYVYINGPEGITKESKATRILSRKMRDTECAELHCQEAWFGLALTTPGDLDQDNYQDLVVGAPFEGRGAIYIFRGSSHGLRTEFSQRITPSDLFTSGLQPLTSFGYSLSGGLDIDDNGYPDILVGAFQSDTVVVLRTRPVVNIMTTLHAYPPRIDPKLTQCRRDGLPYNCFKLQACLRFTINPANRFTGTMDVDLMLESEKFTGATVVRAFFLENNKESHIHNETVTMNRQIDPRYKCIDITAYIIRSNRDFLNPIRFQLTYRLSKLENPSMSPGQTLPDLTYFPVINESLSRIYHSVDFIKNCGNDSMCESNVMVRGILQLNRDEAGQYVLKVGQDRELRLYVRVRNSGEDAHETVVTVLIPPLLEYLGTDNDYSCALNEDDSVTCDVGNPLPRNHEVSFGIRLDTDKLESSVSEMEIVLIVNTTSNEMDREDDVDRIKVKVIIETDLAIDGFSDPSHVFYGGEVVGESAMQFIEDIGPEVTHGYELSYKGSGNVRNTIVTISWPYEVQSYYASGKHLLYLTELPQVKPSGRCFVEDGRLNPLHLTSRESPTSQYPSQDDVSLFSGALLLDSSADPSLGKSNGHISIAAVTDDESSVAESTVARSRRETMDDSESSNVNSNIVTLDCDSGTAKCCSIVCKIDKMPSTGSIVIKVKSRLWNSTFLEDFVSVHHVDILSRAELRIDPSLSIRQLSRQNDIARARTQAFPDVQVQKPAAVPLWVIIVAICIGIFLLILIVLLLFKCGFFRRRHKDNNIGYYTATKLKQPNYFDVDQ